MRRLLLLTLCLLLCGLSGFGQEADTLATVADTWQREAHDGYYVELMDIEMTVHANNTYDIVEKLDVCFVEPRHGIIRDIPDAFWVNRDTSDGQDGSKHAMRLYELGIDGIEVSEPYQKGEAVSADIDQIELKIGQADVVVEGRHSYRIAYSISLPGDRVPQGDLFFHSLIGNDWTASMDSVHFVIHYDKQLPDEAFDHLQLYCGEVGDSIDRAHDFIDRCDYHTIEGSLVQLPSRNGLTVHMPLPEGYFDIGPTPVWTYLAWISALFTLALLLYLLAAEVMGDKSVPTVICFKPSKGMTSADVGSLVDGWVDDIDLLSLIPWFASQGLLSIKTEDKKCSVYQIKPLPSDAPKYQQYMFDALFGKGSHLDFSKPSSRFSSGWYKAKTALTELYDDKKDSMGEYRKLLLIATVGMSLTVCWGMTTSSGWMYGGLCNVFLIGFHLFMANIPELWRNASGCAKVVYLPILLFGYLFIVAMMMVLPQMCEDWYIPLGMGQALMALMLLVISLQKRLYRMTPYRREHLQEVKGLKRFIETAEAHRLRQLLDEDEEYFYDILPYAMVFGMVDKWAKKFEDLPVKAKPEFMNARPNEMGLLLSQKTWRSNLARITPVASSSGYSGSSHGGSYSSARSHSGGYSGGGSGGGGGRSW